MGVMQNKALWLTLMSGAGSGSVVVPDTYLVIFTGESNSGGKASNSSPSAGELAARSAVQILNNTSLLFEDLDVGTNNLIGHVGLTNNATHGLEIGLANTVVIGRWPKSQIHLVKTGQGGSTALQWESGNGSGYWTTFQTRVDAAIAELEAAELTYVPLVFMSLGMNDGIGGTSEATFKSQIETFISQIRTYLGGTTRIVMTTFDAPINEYAMINSALTDVANADPYTSIVATDDATTVDSNHWDYEGFLQIAERVIDDWFGASGQLAAPSLSPAGGEYATDQSVTITGPSGSTIVYTTDTSAPSSNDTHYSSPVTVTLGNTLRAVAIKQGSRNSVVTSETYTAPPALATWDSSRKSGDVTLSNGDLDASLSAGGWDAVISTIGKSSGALYFEIRSISLSGSDNLIYGLADGTTSSAATLNTFVGNFADSIGWRGNFAAENGTTFTVIGNGTAATPGTSTVMVAVDFASGSIWTGLDGTWTGATPSTGGTTGRQGSFTGSPILYPAASFVGAGGTARIRMKAADFSYSPPSGFSAWTT